MELQEPSVGFHGSVSLQVPVVTYLLCFYKIQTELCIIILLNITRYVVESGQFWGDHFLGGVGEETTVDILHLTLDLKGGGTTPDRKQCRLLTVDWQLSTIDPGP